jgi:DNA-binding MarR family transcriptional regulator
MRPARSRLPIDDSLFFKLVRLINLTARPFQEGVGRQAHLSLNEWRVMVVLVSHPGIAGADVAFYTGLDKMSVSRALAALARAKRIKRQVDTSDNRRTRISLSAAGQRVFEEVGALAKLREAQFLHGISRTQIAQVSAVIDAMTRNVLAD